MTLLLRVLIFRKLKFSSGSQIFPPGDAMIFTYEVLSEVVTGNFSKEQMIGKGGFGRVFRDI